MSKHKDYCPSFKGSLEQQAEEIDSMTHEAKSKLFGKLYELSKLREQQELTLGRHRYYEALAKQVNPGLKTLVDGENNCWRICRKYTEIESRIND